MSRRQMRESQFYKEASTGFHALANRIFRVLRELNRENLRRILPNEVATILVGLSLFAIFGRLFFGANISLNALESLALATSFRWCGLVMCLSVIVASWSVGGAFCHVLSLMSGWLRLYSAGGK